MKIKRRFSFTTCCGHPSLVAENGYVMCWKQICDIKKEKDKKRNFISRRPGIKWLQCRSPTWKDRIGRAGFGIPPQTRSPLGGAATGHPRVWGCEWVDGVGLHHLVHQEQESSHDGQQEELYPQRHAVVRCLGRPCRGRCRQKPGGGGRRNRGGGGGGGAGQAADFVDSGALCVRGGEGRLGGFWREEAVLIIPDQRATGGSFNGSPTGRATRDTNTQHRLLYSLKIPSDTEKIHHWVWVQVRWCHTASSAPHGASDQHHI